jgi:putative solute:sodium symporter small subunit
MSKNATKYWKTNVKYVSILLFVWFIVSFGAGIIFKEELDVISVGGFKLGFWFAQQGSMYLFVIIIFVYIYLMNKLDKKYGFDAVIPSKSDWWFGISPEGFGSVAMCINFIVSLVVSKFTKPTPEHIKLLVEKIRIPSGVDEVNNNH